MTTFQTPIEIHMCSIVLYLNPSLQFHATKEERFCMTK